MNGSSVKLNWTGTMQWKINKKNGYAGIVVTPLTENLREISVPNAA
jgi:hypothetical protein